MRFIRIVVAAATGLGLAACADPLSSYQPTEAQRYLRDTFGPRYQVTVEPIYCYTTLADPDCYARPVPGWEHRLVAHYGPQPH